jgi:WD40 repeat protein
VDSAEPIIKSDPLSKESPIDEARISASGDVIVYGVESSYGAIVLIDKNTKNIIWKYETPQGRSVRALAMTPSGEFIGAGTFGGDVLLFGRKSNIPIEKIKINSTIGAFDLSDDGSIFVTGSADKKIRIFHKGEGRARAEIKLNEYVGELDVSANGKFAVAGTSGSVYFFETLIDLNNTKALSCTKVIEPPEEDTSLFGGQNSGGLLGKTEGQKFSFSPMIISAFSTVLFLTALVVYILICHKKKLKPKKLILISLFFLIFISFSATVFFFWKDKKQDSQNTIPIETISGENYQGGEDGNVIDNSGSKEIDTGGVQKADQNLTEKNVCGNGMCEPNLGETKENCSKDCTPSE